MSASVDGSMDASLSGLDPHEVLLLTQPGRLSAEVPLSGTFIGWDHVPGVCVLMLVHLDFRLWTCKCLLRINRHGRGQEDKEAAPFMAAEALGGGGEGTLGVKVENQNIPVRPPLCSLTSSLQWAGSNSYNFHVSSWLGTPLLEKIPPLGTVSQG